MTIFIVIYLLALLCYLYTRNTENMRYRAINKYIMSTMYLGLGIHTFLQRYQFTSYHTLLLAALILAWFGDFFLVFDFGRGGDFFLSGNICFTLYYQCVMADFRYSLGDFGWSLIVAATMVIAFILACQFWPNVFKLGKMRWLMTFYLSSIFTHGLTGLAMALLMRGSNYMIMGIGSVLFMISDMILTAYKFVFGRNKWLVRANSITYFIGLLLIVLGMAS